MTNRVVNDWFTPLRRCDRARLVPDKTGSFVFLCDVFCGIGHENMSGKLTVVE